MASAELKQQRSITYNNSHSETSGAIRRSGTTGNTSLAAITKANSGSTGVGGGIGNYSNRNASGISSGSRSVDSLGDHSISQRTANTSDTGGGYGGGGSSLLSSIGGGSRSTCRAGASSNDALISQHGSHVEIVVDSTKLESSGGGVGTAIGRSIRIGSINRHRNSTISSVGGDNSGVGIIGTGESSIEELEPGDEENGGGGGGGSISGRKRRHRRKRRPLLIRLISYIRGAFSSVHFSSSADSELEELEHLPPRYRPDSLSALCRATRFSEAEIKRIYRGFKAECPTGIIREETFKLIYASFFPQGANTGLYAHYVFNTLDQDNSGIVSFEDFVQGLSVLSRGSMEEKLRWTFSLYDINGDGFISREEMTDIVTAIYELMGRRPDTCPDVDIINEKVNRLFEKMDLNRDGVVTLDEFLDCCRNDETISRSINVFDSSF